jgi:hypothetical protein
VGELRPRDPEAVPSTAELTALKLHGCVPFNRFEVEDGLPSTREAG